MKPNVWLEFSCKQYPKSYGIKVWESGGSWSRPSKWYEKSLMSSNMRSVYAGGSKVESNYDKIKQKGGLGPAACIPCIATTNPAGMVIGAAGACIYGVHKTLSSKKKKSKKKKSKKKKSKKK